MPKLSDEYSFGLKGASNSSGFSARHVNASFSNDRHLPVLPGSDDLSDDDEANLDLENLDDYFLDE